MPLCGIDGTEFRRLAQHHLIIIAGMRDNVGMRVDQARQDGHSRKIDDG
jgi:hypothetical protein